MPGRPLADPVADGVGAVPLEERQGVVGHVAGRLRELLAVGVDDEPGDGGVGPRQEVVLVVAADDRGEQPGADDLVGLRAQVHREGAREQVGVVLPPADDLRAERRRRPRVHHVGIGGEPAGLVALRLVVARAARAVVGSIGSDGLVGEDRREAVDDAVGVDRVPDRERHAEEPLAGDVPVADQAVDPVLVADAHEVGPPRAARCRGRAARPSGVADEPLLARDDLERPRAVLPELHRVGDRAGLALDARRRR